eukprot:ctg_2434.g499
MPVSVVVGIVDVAHGSAQLGLDVVVQRATARHVHDLRTAAHAQKPWTGRAACRSDAPPGCAARCHRPATPRRSPRTACSTWGRYPRPHTAAGREMARTSPETRSCAERAAR